MQPLSLTQEEFNALSPAYVSPELVIRPFDLRRIHVGGDRFYYRIEDGAVIWYKGVTSLTGNYKEKNVANILSDWALNNFNSPKERDEFMDHAADYGTFVHTMTEDVLIRSCIGGTPFDLDTDVEDWYEKATSRHKHPGWINKAKEDLLFFINYFNSVQFKPLAIEIQLYSDTLGLAGTADNIGWITNPKTGAKNLAIIDLKTGRSSAKKYDYLLQLYIYKLMWEEHFPQFGEVTKLINIQPKEVRASRSGKPKFEANVTDWTPNEIEAAKIMLEGKLTLDRAFAKLASKDATEKTSFRYSGKIGLGLDVDDAIQVSNYEGAILTAWQQWGTEQHDF